ncbi:FeoB-associated Cys-rich membrane protein [Clostridium sp. DL1XJH146]
MRLIQILMATIILVPAIVFSVLSLRKSIKNGGCSGGCSGCSLNGKCDEDYKNKNS